MAKPIYLTEKFKQDNPVGTRVRHPQIGSAKIVEVHATHLIVEWESPMARIEQSNRIEASVVPFMSRLTEVRTPQQARSNYDSQAMSTDHSSALRVQDCVKKIEVAIDNYIDRAHEMNAGSHSQDGVFHIRIPLYFEKDTNNAIIFTLSGSDGPTALCRAEQFDVSPVVDAIQQYYGQHGWSVTWDQNGIRMSHQQLPESYRVRMRNAAKSVNNKTLNFNEALKG